MAVDAGRATALTAPGLPAAGPTAPRWVGPTAVALVVALVGALVAVVWFGLEAVRGFGVEHGRSNALAAAEEVATNFTTFGAGTAEADTARLLKGTTPRYAASVEGDRGSLLKKVREMQSRSTGTVTEAGVLSYDAATSTARVLVSVRAKVSNTRLPAGQDRDYRMELTMVDQSGWPGGWLADAVEFRS